METNIDHTVEQRMKEDAAKVRYDRNARFFNFMDSLFGKGMSRKKNELVAQAKGRILEVGIGTGNSLKYYPAGTELVGIDISPNMLERAKGRIDQFSGKLDLRIGDVQSLDFPDNSFDMVITSCVFCSVSDPVRGFREINRVLKPGGIGLHLEHVRSKRPIIGKLMDILNPIVVRMAGANINRNTAENIRKSGLIIVEEDDLWLDILKFLKVTKGNLA